MNKFEQVGNISETEPVKNELEEDIIRVKEILGLSEEDFRNKTTLDLGAGSANLARYFEGRDDINIISLDLESERLKLADGAVQADAKKLPFRDESFDLIAELGGPAGLEENPNDTKSILSEMKRVLRPDGEIRIGRGYLSPTMFEDPGEDLSLEERKQYFREQSRRLIESIGFDVEEIDTGDDLYDFYYRLRKQQESEQ